MRVEACDEEEEGGGGGGGRVRVVVNQPVDVGSEVLCCVDWARYNNGCLLCAVDMFFECSNHIMSLNYSLLSDSDMTLR